MTENDPGKIDKIVSLCKRRGFVFPGSEIYGGMANSYDLGPLGTELFHNIGKLWWKKFVTEREDMLGVRGAVIMNPKVWEASGHVTGFSDPLIECKLCHQRFRADHEDEMKVHENSHPDREVSWTAPKNFNLLFKTFVGTVEDEKSVAYLRGETAATMFTDFSLFLDSTRKKLPFGIAQIGKAFRNEITPGNFLFRTREFTIAELEYFVRPGDDDDSFDMWLEFMNLFTTRDLGLNKERLRHYEHPKEQLAHYSKQTIDIEYNFPWGWGEVFGLANRTDFDLKNHERMSGANLKYRDSETGEEFWPYAIEPTVGLERLMLTVLLDAYRQYEGGRSGEDGSGIETVLHIAPHLAPVAAAVLPLSKKAELTEPARMLAKDLRKCFNVEYDETQSIGKRYRRQDEIGTPYCVTYDFESPKDLQVTVRDRDSMKQERIALTSVATYLRDKLIPME